MNPDSPPAPSTVLVAHPGAELYGSDRVMLETLAGLLERGHRVVLSTPVDGPLLAAARDLGAETLVLDVPVLRKAMLRPTRLAVLGMQALRATREIDGLLRRVRPDAVYVSTLTTPLWTLRARAAGIPAVVHVHESERGASMLLRRAIAAPLLAADRVLVNSCHSRESLLEALPRLAERSVVVYNGVAGPPRVVPARSSVADGLRVVYIGRLSPRKGVDIAVEAIGALHGAGIPARLDIVGGVFGGYEWYERSLREQIDRLGLGQHVTFHGFRPSVWEVLEGGDVAVVPSRLEEPFGNTAVEALLAARAVVVSDIGGLGEAIAGYPSAVAVPADDPAALAAGLAGIAARWPELRPQLGAVASAAAERYAPAAYRDAVVAELSALLPIDPRHPSATSTQKEAIPR